MRRMLRGLVYLPYAPIPDGRLVELPGRGMTYVTDTPGPAPDSPTVLLLHALATTGRLTWYPSIPALSRRYRVLTMDQRWHGRGIQSERFSLRECADDAAALLDVLGLDRVLVGGYSMGSLVAQRVWRQHPERVTGLVLGATTDRFQTTFSERAFHQSVAQSMLAVRATSRARTATNAERAADRETDVRLTDIHDWAISEFTSTSPWAVGQAVAAIGRHHSRPWLSRIDVPTAVIVPTRDRAISPERQYGVARAIAGATVHEIDAGHACVVLEAEKFVPAMVEACATVTARARDMTNWRRPAG